MQFKDLDTKEKALNTLNEYIYITRIPDLTEEQVRDIQENYDRAMKLLKENKERFCMLSALRAYSFQLEGKDNPTKVEEDIINLQSHIEDALIDFILTNF